jgi:hypothetical protein
MKTATTLRDLDAVAADARRVGAALQAIRTWIEATPEAAPAHRLSTILTALEAATTRAHALLREETIHRVSAAARASARRN